MAAAVEKLLKASDARRVLTFKNYIISSVSRSLLLVGRSVGRVYLRWREEKKLQFKSWIKKGVYSFDLTA